MTGSSPACRRAAQYGIPARPVEPDRWLEAGDTVEIGDRTFEVLHCPGHTPGHVVFVNRGLNFGLFGDVLFRGSVGRTDLPRGSHEDLIHSIKSRILPLGDQFTFLCGHGPGSTVGEERLTNPFLAEGTSLPPAARSFGWHGNAKPPPGWPGGGIKSDRFELR